MLDLNSRAKPGDVSAKINALLDAAMKAKPRETRGYLGASALGDACDRRLQYKFVQVPPDKPEFAERTYRIFDRGHWGEDYTLAEMRDAGFLVKSRADDGGQIGFAVADGKFKGHCDGVILSAPFAMKLPAVWEHKQLGSRGWAAVVRDGVASAYPAYAAQIALYQAYLDLPAPALFTATNADTMERYHELVAFDRDLAQRASDRAVKIIKATEAQELLPRAAVSPDLYVCRGCAWFDTCWGKK